MKDIKISLIDLSKRDAQMFMRCPVELKSQIIKSAKRATRSISAEMALRLAQSLEEREFIGPVDGEDY